MFPTTGCTYLWQKDGTSIPGAVLNTYVATTTGNYRCIVTKTETGCFNTSNSIIVTVDCKVGEIQTLELSIYPNPANDKFVIQSDEQISAIEIYNLAWEMISLKVDFNQQLKQEINVSLFPAGIYFVKVLCNDKLYYKRLIIQRR